MKKILTILLAVLMACTLMGCSKKTNDSANENVEKENEVSENTTATDVISKYTIVNTTGEDVVELYLYLAGSDDQKVNLLDASMEDSAILVLDETICAELATVKSDSDKAGDTFVLEFKTESGYLGKFETLYREEATISLLSADVAAGATQIAFIANAENITSEAE